MSAVNSSVIHVPCCAKCILYEKLQSYARLVIDQRSTKLLHVCHSAHKQINELQYTSDVSSHSRDVLATRTFVDTNECRPGQDYVHENRLCSSSPVETGKKIGFVRKK